MLASLQVLPRSWKAKIYNKWKVSFWEVLQNAPLSAERMWMASPCGCGTCSPSPRGFDHFVECPPARAVYDKLQTGVKLTTGTLERDDGGQKTDAVQHSAEAK